MILRIALCYVPASDKILASLIASLAHKLTAFLSYKAVRSIVGGSDINTILTSSRSSPPLMMTSGFLSSTVDTTIRACVDSQTRRLSVHHRAFWTGLPL